MWVEVLTLDLVAEELSYQNTSINSAFEATCQGAAELKLLPCNQYQVAYFRWCLDLIFVERWTS